MTLLIILSAVVGYLLGSANSSLIVGKFYGVDVRQHGSGNAGLTNTLRTLGKSAALLVLAGDIVKGVLAYWVGYLTAGYIGGMVGGVAAILGHNWPVYFKFKGGKGVLTSLAVLLMMDWRVALIALGVFAVIVALTRYVSLGSILASVLLPVISLLLNKDIVFVIFVLAIGLLTIYRHSSNIGRLLKGTESKLGAKKTKGE